MGGCDDAGKARGLSSARAACLRLTGREARRTFAMLKSACRFAALATALVFSLPAAPPQFSALPALPPAPGQTRQAGQAAPFAGVHGDALIVGGGANFPQAMPWDGGANIWWDDVFVLERGAGAWRTGRTFKLPRPLAYGFSFSTPEGVVCVGGGDAAQCYADVFLLAWDAQKKEVTTTALPPLPAPLAFMAGAQLGSLIYVLGGQREMKPGAPTRTFWSLDLARRERAGEFKWEELPAWPGPARIVPVAAALGGRVFLLSGREPQPGRAARILTDAFAYDPAARTWRTFTAPPRAMMAATAAAVGDEIWVFGGDDGRIFSQLEAFDLGLRSPPAGKREILEAHPGFARDIVAYDPRRDAWRTVARSPEPLPVTTIAVPWGGALVLPSGEVRPGVRTTAVLRVAPAAP
jgi:N-acetylneuraminic acid mutarotase